MKIINGDLIELAKQGEFDVIVHGCNCFNTMGAGIAKHIRYEFPRAYNADCNTLKGNIKKLGSFSQHTYISDNYQIKCVIINAYTQFNYLPRGECYDYEAIALVFRKIAHLYPNARIGYPAIGCGLAGGDWNIVAEIIDKELKGCDHTYVKYNK